MYPSISFNRPFKVFLFPALLALFLISCDRNRIFEDNQALSRHVWPSTMKLSYECDIPSVTAGYNVYLNVRNAPEYPYSNLYLFLTTTFPDGSISKDTIELTLAGNDGRWLGSGMGSVKFSRFLFKEDVRFPQAGIYRFQFEQAMRTAELKGITDFGMRVEKR